MGPGTSTCRAEGILIVHYDDKAYRLTETLERSIVRLNLESQGEFVALISAIQMQLDSGTPVEPVVRLLAEAVIALADARGVKDERLRLNERLETVVERVARLSHKTERR